MSATIDFLETLFGDPLPADTRIALWRKEDKCSIYLEAPEQAAEHENKVDVYVTAGLVPASLAELGAYRRLKARECAGIPGVWIDADVNGGPDNKTGVCPTRAAADRLVRVELEPTVLVNSGYGLQAWWLFDEPWTFGLDEEREQAERITAGWEALHRQQAKGLGFGLDSVSDLARLMRLPGTTNAKGGLQAPVTIVEGTGVLYAREEIAERALLAASSATAVAFGAEISANGRLTNAELEQASYVLDRIKLDALVENDDRFRKTWERTRPDAKAKRWSASQYGQAIATLAAPYCTDEELAGLLGRHQDDHGNKGNKGHEFHYLRPTIDKARAERGEPTVAAARDVSNPGDVRGSTDVGQDLDRERESSSLGEIPAFPVDTLQGPARTLLDAPLPTALMAGATLGAIAAAIGGSSVLEVESGWRERLILWVPLLAPRGAGKSPAQGLAFGPLRDRDASLADDDAGRTLLGDTTLEALARELHQHGHAGALDLDELAVLLRGLGEYKRGGGGDRGRVLALWEGAPWRYTRVGASKKGANEVRLHLPQPTLTIVGGLQPALHGLLGGDEDGLRPRWLPHLAAMPDTEAPLWHDSTERWATLLNVLADGRAHAKDRRVWRLSPPATRAFESHRNFWKRQSRSPDESAGVSAALVKADKHLARIALVIAEADKPLQGGSVTEDQVDRAALWVNFTIDCWRALPEYDVLSLSLRDRTLDGAIPRLVAWLEDHGGTASRRELQRTHVAGARTQTDLDALLARYEAIYPGTVTEETSSHGGMATKIVKLPRRRKPNVAKREMTS